MTVKKRFSKCAALIAVAVLADSYENNVYVGPYKALDDLGKILNSGAAK